MLLKGLKKGLAEDKGQSGTLTFVSKPQGKCQLSVKFWAICQLSVKILAICHQLSFSPIQTLLNNQIVISLLMEKLASIYAFLVQKANLYIFLFVTCWRV